MTTGCDYHSPQFSEDVHWLPPWLQSHHLPFPGDDHPTGSSEILPLQIPSKNNVLDSEFSAGRDSGLLMSREPRCSDFHLFISGEDVSPLNSTPCLGTASHFDLHLSSKGISQISSDHPQSRDPVRIFKTNNCSHNEYFSEGLVVQNKTNNTTPKQSLSSMGCSFTKFESNKRNIEKLEREKWQRNSLSRRSISKSLMFSKKCKQVKSDDLIEAVELSIAASEAVVISELLSTSMELLSAEAILEISLRVKHARNHFHSNTLYTSTKSTYEIDESDQLSDLDDTVMVDAFEDAGICCTEVISDPDCKNDWSCEENNCVVNTHVSESQLGHDAQQNSELDPQNIDVHEFYKDTSVAGTQFSKNHMAFGTEVQNSNSNGSISSWKDMAIDAISFQKLEPTNICVDSTTLHRNCSLQADTLTSHQENTVDLTLIQKSFGEDKNPKVTSHGYEVRRKIVPNFFNAESSSISESLVNCETASVHRPLEGMDVIVSSRKTLEDIHRSVFEENKCHNNEEFILSQELAGSSDFPFMDPLCSVVPCSISSDSFSSLVSNQKIYEETTGNWLDPSLEHGDKLGSRSNVVEPDPSTFIHMSKNTIFDKGDDSGVYCKHLPSLKTYSMVMPINDVVLASNIAFDKKKSAYRTDSSKEDTLGFHLENKTNSQQIKKSISVNHDLCVNNEKSDRCSLCGGQSLELANPDRTRVFLGGTQLKDQNDGNQDFDWACAVISDSEKEDEGLIKTPKLFNKIKNNVAKSLQRNQMILESSSMLHSGLCPHPQEQKGPFCKKVHFSEAEPSAFPKDQEMTIYKYDSRLQSRRNKRVKRHKPSISRNEKGIFNCIGKLHMQSKKKLIFRSLQFLLTGFSRNKEIELETLIRIHGGIVLPTIPNAFHSRGKLGFQNVDQHRPIVLSLKKLQTTKFLYGCAIDTWLLDAKWLEECIQAGSVLPPKKYMILPNQNVALKNLIYEKATCCSEKPIFGELGIMLYGKTSFCTKYSNIIRHGGGQVFKTLQWLVKSMKNGNSSIGAIVVEDDINISRHLKHCAFEHNLQTMPATWIVKSLFSGKLLPLK